MSKGLEALNDILENTDVDFVYRYWGGDSPLDIVRKELEEYQHHEEILNDYGLTLANFREACLLLAMLKGEGRTIHNIDKRLKALEIITEKNVAITMIKQTQSVTEYNMFAYDFLQVKRVDKEKYKLSPQPLDEEEYDLLKEVLL